MALETGDYIANLVATNPAAADPKAQGDDHLRLIKAALLQCFAGFSGSILITGTDGGAANVYTLTPTPALLAYSPRMLVAFTPTVSNTGAATINISGLGAKAVTSVSGEALVAGDLPAGTPQWAAYDGTQFRLTSPTKRFIEQLAFSAALPNQAGNGSKFLSTDGTNGIWAYAQNMPRSARTANAQLVQADRATLVEITSGTFTQSFDTPANLGSGWYVFLWNSGTGDITIPSSDGVTNWVMYPGEMRLFQCNGTAFRSVIVRPFNKTFVASGTFAKPPGYSLFQGLAWSGGQGGNKVGATSTTPGGSGGGCFPFHFPAAALAASESVQIGAGGAGATTNPSTGNPGGNTTFGTLLTVFGGDSNGGGAIGAGYSAAAAIRTVIGNLSAAAGFGGGHTTDSVSTVWGGATSIGNAPAGNSLYGGGSGQGVNGSTLVGSAGTSKFGGNGGAGATFGSGSDGAAPGGGGGSTTGSGNGGAGARGELRIWGVV